jgi:hypothetical protein
MARASVWDDERFGREVPKPSLPVFNLTDIDIEREAKEAAARVATTRIIRRGRDCWDAIHKSESFEGWAAIGAALAIGKSHALRVTGANRAWGSAYSREFGQWMKINGFRLMRPSDRSCAIELHENFVAISAWRDSLDNRERRRLIGAQANVKRWRIATQPRPNADAVAKAECALKHFLSCMAKLPADQAAPLWQMAQTQAAAALAA